MRKRERVVLVDENGHDLIDQDGVITTMEKLIAHRLGILHLPDSEYIYNIIKRKS